MSNMHEMPNHRYSDHDSIESDLEALLLGGVESQDQTQQPFVHAEAASPAPFGGEEDEEDREVYPDHDVQGALGLFAEAAQDMTTATLEIGLGRHFACADYCNQVAEKAAQAVSLLNIGRRSPYNHDLRALGAQVGAPDSIQEEMARLSPFHPEAFYADTPPEEADEVISADEASSYIQSARTVLRWARNIVLTT
ncbi:HEPN domain-containing protein [Ktedonobacter robiniae]|uniref:HEPN domain-containing protein n=1 Tax=Ktedonobacter robiniae TaxID=2778365 RepID=A0ABQ3UNY4_9CHLR|nr:HEPN domain-containing protein [Ktedonobacter robiniae]GHO54085.1 hypothetical protein KSB_25600 [Ktedonobacter robiniae]